MRAQEQNVVRSFVFHYVWEELSVFMWNDVLPYQLLGLTTNDANILLRRSVELANVSNSSACGFEVQSNSEHGIVRHNLTEALSHVPLSLLTVTSAQELTVGCFELAVVIKRGCSGCVRSLVEFCYSAIK